MTRVTAICIPIPTGVDEFIEKAKETFPGSVEVLPARSTWSPHPGSAVEPTPAQCADPAERQRLWREHGVHWVKTTLPAPIVLGKDGADA